MNMKQNFRNNQEVAGELAVRNMSSKAQEFYNGTDCITLYECIEDVLDENGDFVCDEDGNELEVKRYYVRGYMNRDGLTFEEVEHEFEAQQDEFDSEQEY